MNRNQSLWIPSLNEIKQYDFSNLYFHFFSETKAANKLGGDPQIKKHPHDIRITNQIMYLHPSIEDCRYTLLQELFAWQAVVTSTERIQSTRYQGSDFVS